MECISAATKASIEACQQKTKLRVDENANPRTFRVGDLVKIVVKTRTDKRNRKKRRAFAAKFEGPYRVKELPVGKSENILLLEMGRKQVRTINKRWVYPWFTRLDGPPVSRWNTRARRVARVA